MSKHSFTTVVVLVILVVLGWFLFSKENVSAPTEESPTQEIVTVPSPVDNTTPPSSVTPSAKTVTVNYTDSGFSPSNVTLNVGDTVMFKNTSSRNSWPASAMHPTHTVYPGSDIKKCDTSAERTIFDACRAITPGGSWSFTFTQKGSWGYHDHLNAGHFGKIIVE